MNKAFRTPHQNPKTIPLGPVADLIGIDRSTAYRWLARGILPKPTIKVGRTVRWSVQSIENFISEGVTA